MDSITQFITEILGSQTGGIGVTQFIALIFLTYFGGVLSSLTPCIYPTLPITISVMGGMGAKEKSWQALTIRGLVYISGMSLVFSFLGIFAALTGKIFGSITNTPGWYFTLGLVMVIAALFMLEVFHFDIRIFWDRMSRKLFGHKTHAPSRNDLTLLGTFGLGATSGILASPCTTPVLASILAYIAGTRSVPMGISMMLAFSAGLSTILLVLAVFAGAVKVLPRSGVWMNGVKVGSGVLLLLFAFYLFYEAATLKGLL